MTTEILRENWQKIEFCHSEAIPDQFQIDLRIAKVWGKAKALQTPKPESDHKMYQNLEFYGISFAKKSWNQFRIQSASTWDLKKCWQARFCFATGIILDGCSVYHDIGTLSEAGNVKPGGDVVVVWRSCGGRVAVVWQWCGILTCGAQKCGRATAQEWF